MHSGFSALRSSLPMNLRTEGRRIAIWSAAQGDIDRITEIWRECLETWKGPWLFGRQPTIGDAMYAPVVTRFRSYDVKVDPVSAAYCAHILGWPDLAEWVAAAQLEPEQIEELEVEF
jgi:glutathione S-transferase